ncbi:glycosyltransferase [Priestia megaterium]|uniref:glycosyltransferase n=1 Tax=Priestia megaterium TaxID=1404 RepID=UPI0021D66DEB|nr:glycosyltransferase [Priestia megaterium]MCU7713029.1 glycosyltransferase [Priestia megaterium]
MKICFLVTEHSFLDVRIFKKEARSLAKKGFEITIIVPKVNGRLFNIDGKKITNSFGDNIFMHEGIKFVTYKKVNLSTNLAKLKQNIISHTHKNFSDPLTRLGVAEKADVYHAHEYFSLYSGVGIKRILKERKVKLIYDSHELDPDPYITNSKTKNMMIEMLKGMLKEVDYIITVSESIKSWYQDLNSSIPIEVIYNSPPLTPSYNEHYYPDNDKNDILIVHEGIIDDKRGNPQKMFEIIDICNKEINLTFRIIGGTKEGEKERLKIPPHLVNHIELIGWVDYHNIPQSISGANLGWIDLQPAKFLNHQFAMPNKFFSYLNNGVPVLVNKCKDMEDFINEYQCGHVVNKIDAKADDYASAIISLSKNPHYLKKMSINARKIMEKQFSWSKMEKILFDIYDSF